MPAPSERWYVNDEDGNRIGPLTRSDLEYRLDTGRLDPGDRVWDSKNREWVTVNDIPDLELPGEGLSLSDDPDEPADEDTPVTSSGDELQTPPLDEALACVNHPERQAVGHCFYCGNLLCESCIHFKRNGSFCSDCSPDDVDRLPENVPSEFFRRWIYYARQYPSVGITLVVLGFIALSLIFGPALEQTLSGEFGTGDARLYLRQLNRTHYRAQKLSAEDNRSGRNWYRLARSAGDKILDRQTVSDQLKSRVLLQLLRINHELQAWDRYRELLDRVPEILPAPGQNPNVKFFRALYELDAKQNYRSASESFEQLRELFSPGSDSYRTPSIPDHLKYPLFHELLFTHHELLYHLGRSLRALGQNEKAIRIFLNISVDRSSSWWQRQAGRAMRK